MRFKVIRINNETKQIGVIDLEDFIIEDYDKEYLCKVNKKYPIIGVQSNGRITCESIFNTDFELELIHKVGLDYIVYNNIATRLIHAIKHTKSGDCILDSIKTELYFCGLYLYQMEVITNCIIEELRR